jgi:hypothetical protein
MKIPDRGRLKIVIPAEAGTHFALCASSEDQNGFPLSLE